MLTRAIPFAGPAYLDQDTVVQSWPGVPNMPSVLLQWEGVSNVNSVAPPDTQGDVGPNHYVQWNNLSFQIWNKTGTSLYGPAAGNTLWSGFGGPCESWNNGDPITLYDPLADRWFMSQFGVNGPFYQCIAVSQTGDPTGSWYLYEYLWSGNLMNDYPKFGVWPDGYYMTINQFDANLGYAPAGVGVAAFERSAMLVGNPAQMVAFDLYGVDPNYFGMLPSDLDGPAPPAGTPNYFAEVEANEWVWSQDQISIFEFHVDWGTPANSTFGIAGDPNDTIATAPFVPDLCGGSRNCIPQPGTAQAVDAISDRLMYRLQYRNFGTHETLVTNHTVDVSGVAGVRWYELRDTGGGWFIQNQGTYSPDTDHRWMGSAAMDSGGNIALGYSVSSGTVYPSIRYTGRLASDPADTMPQGEAEMIAGVGYQNGVNRWGDYSMMAVDPVDDCTFWYTQQYIGTPGNAGWAWQTRIGSFAFPYGNCSGGSRGALDGTVTDSGTLAPISGARVDAGAYTTFADAGGYYRIDPIPSGSYDVTASSYGYTGQTVFGVSVVDDTTTTQDFSLSATPGATVEGTVTDGGAHGWPLYARIDIDHPYFSTTVFTDPLNGQYSVDLLQDETYDFTVSAVIPGYSEVMTWVTPLSDPWTEDFALIPDCSAPGYDQGGVLEDFNGCSLPAGWSIIDNVGTGIVWVFNDPGGRGNITGGDGCFATADSDYFGSDELDTELRTPPMDFGGDASVTLEFDTNYENYASIDEVFVDVNSYDGSGWTNVWYRDYDYHDYNHELVDLTAYAAGQTYVVVRFRYDSNGGSYLWYWDVDNVDIYGDCETMPGGLVVGNVYDQNTGLGLNGATVADGTIGNTAASFATPDDPNVDDGFYTLFTPAYPKAITASKDQYGDDSALVSAVADDVVGQDFYLPAGWLSANPGGVEVSLYPDASTDTTVVTIYNNGFLAAPFNLVEVYAPYRTSAPTGPWAETARHLSPKHLHDLNLASVTYYLLPPDGVAPLAAGDVINTWGTGLALPWGCGYNIAQDDLWVSNPGVGGGDNLDHRYLTDGTNTGDTINTAPWIGSWAADMTYDPLNGTLWQVNVGGDNCIYELDPVAMVATGNSICPPFGTSERGLAYDPVSDTFYAGSWNDSIINHFDRSGVILDSANVGLGIAGLAINPNNGHLFVTPNADSSWYDIYVLDVDDSYNVLGGFNISGMGDFDQAGLEIDCQGHLWAVNQGTGQMFEVDSGETNTCGGGDIPWLTLFPESGTAPAASAPGSTNIDFNIYPDGISCGTYEGYVKIDNDTPYGWYAVPVTLHVLSYNPVADPGGHQEVDLGMAVILDGSASYDPDGTIVDYSWVQLAGEAVTLSYTDRMVASFVAPIVPDTLVFQLNLTDNCGYAGSDTAAVVVQGNQWPVAEAGIDRTVGGGAIVALDGSGSYDPDGTIVSYSWSQTAGTAVTLAGSSSATTSFTAPNVTGSLSFVLSVRDNGGKIASDVVNIGVVANKSPIADAGDDQTVVSGEAVALDGSGSSDPDGTITGYSWVQTAGEAVVLSGANTVNPGFTAPATATTVIFELTVADDDGATDSDAVAVTVLAPPVADAGADQTVPGGAAVALDGSGSSDSDGYVMRYDWSQVAGTVVVLSDTAAAAPVFAAAVTGTYTFELQVTDDDRLTDVDQVTVNVVQNDPPAADAGADQAVAPGAAVTLDGGGSSDPDGIIERYDWVQTAGEAVTLNYADAVTASFAAPDVSGVLEFRLRVTDDFGAAAFDTVSVVVNVAPEARAGGDQEVLPGDPVVLDGSGSYDLDGTIVGYEWAQASGTSVSLAFPDSVTSPFLAPDEEGTLTFSLTVTDDAGFTSTDTVTVAVSQEATSGCDCSVNPRSKGSPDMLLMILFAAGAFYFRRRRSGEKSEAKAASKKKGALLAVLVLGLVLGVVSCGSEDYSGTAGDASLENRDGRGRSVELMGRDSLTADPGPLAGRPQKQEPGEIREPEEGSPAAGEGQEAEYIDRAILAPAAVEGTVTDAGAHGWPLYARIDIDHSVNPALLFTDPSTGYYSVVLTFGEAFTFTVTAPGYFPEVRVVTPASDPQTEDFALAPKCTALGYQVPSTGSLSEDFNDCSLPAGWSIIDNVGTGIVWVFNDPSERGNITGGDGCFATADSDYFGSDELDTELRTPPMDFGGDASVTLEFDTNYENYAGYDEVFVDVNSYDGSGWTNVWYRDYDYHAYNHEFVDLTAYAAGQTYVVVRFRYDSNGYNYLWYWDVDNVNLYGDCEAVPGGLVVGNVYDQNTGLGLNDALVDDQAGSTADTQATPDDPAVDDGFYTLFTPAGDKTLLALKNKYGDDSALVSAVADDVVGQDFTLPAGMLSTPGPYGFEVTLFPGASAHETLVLYNDGFLAAPFSTMELYTLQAPYPPGGSGPIGPLAPGDVINTWGTGLTLAWGCGYNIAQNDLWVSNPGAGGGDDLNHRYLTDGTSTGDTIDTTPWIGAWAADMTYDPVNGTLWQVNVGGDNCIYELDPVAMVATGDSICPPFGTSERGLAYDPVSDTFYAGSWNDSIINHFDRSGVILDSANVGLGIAGLAFNPNNGHLFVTPNAASPVYDIYVLDVNDGYNVLSSFDIPGMGDFDQAGLEIDCQGHLWAVNQGTGEMFEVDSGETGACPDIPWLVLTPESGTLPAASAPAMGTIDFGFFPVADLHCGVYEGKVMVRGDTPYGELYAVAVTLNVASLPPEIVAPDRYADPGGAVILDGSASYDPDGTIQTVFWSQVDGNPVTLANVDRWRAAFTAPDYPQEITFQIEVVDDCAESATQTVLVFVGIEQFPTANAGEDQAVMAGDTVFLHGSGEDLDGWITGYNWTQIGGSVSVSLSGGTSATASFIAPNSSTSLSFRLRVTDNDGHTGEDVVGIAVTANTPPTADAGPDQTVVAGTMVTLSGSGSDTDGTIVGYSWVQTGGASVSLTQAATATPTFSAPATATVLIFELTVTDNDGDTDTDTMTVTVLAPPTADAGPARTVVAGTEITLDGTGSGDSDGTITRYAWTQTSGSLVSIDYSDNVTAACTLDEVGIYVFNLRVTDDDDLTDTGQVVITAVGNEPPEARAGMDRVVTGGSAVTLDGSASFDPDGLIDCYDWVQTGGEAVTLSGEDTSTAAFSAPATSTTLTFRLMVTDDYGVTGYDTVVITISQAPVADAGADQDVNGVRVVFLNGSASYDPDGSIAGYLWNQTGGRDVTLGFPQAVSSAFITPNVDGPLTFELTVTDDSGLTASDTIVVRVTAVDDEGGGCDCSVTPQARAKPDMVAIMLVAAAAFSFRLRRRFPGRRRRK